MISKQEYEPLKIIKTTAPNNQHINDIDSAFLMREKFITPAMTVETDDCYIYNGFVLTPLGKRVIEEYEAATAKVERETEALSISHQANKLSRWSIFIAAISSLTAVAAFIVALCK